MQSGDEADLTLQPIKICLSIKSTIMQQTFPWLIIIAVGITFLVMVTGVVGMLRPGKGNAKRSNILMRYRIFFQAIAIALVAIEIKIVLY